MNTKAVHAPVAPGQLIRMPAVLDQQGFVQVQHGVGGANTQPEIIVLTGGQGFIKQANLIIPSPGVPRN